MWRLSSLILLLLLMTGCLQEGENMEQKRDAISREKARIEAQLLEARKSADREKELLLTQIQERIERLALEERKSEKEKEVELAKIKMEQTLALSQLEQKYKMEELRLSQEMEKLELEQRKILAQKELEVRRELLLLGFIGLILILIAGLTILYFYKKRRDKLIAYNDNLEKYFRMKEQEAKIAIANKIIDTIAQGKLRPDQEQRLLGVLKGEGKGEELPKLEERGEPPIEATIQPEREDPPQSPPSR
ncbi:MAG: hypothetical protein GXO19_05195 [Epsilonproteobacteria bacterium]|nr:hypothetical protein [Campylobacterota bacterium]NPA57114.1 hypothetical protein [Campylobacterota bacterium]